MLFFHARRLPGLFACLLSTTLVACGGGSEAEPSPVALASPSTEIAVVPLLGHFYAFLGDIYRDLPEQTYVARTESEWSQIWNLHEWNLYDPMEFPPPEKPVVDFSAYTVAGVSQGWGSNGCEGLEIFHITDEPDQIRVNYRRLVWPPLTGCTTGYDPLVAFVKIPATTKPIVFEQAGR